MSASQQTNGEIRVNNRLCPLAIGALWAMLWGCSPPTISPSCSRPTRSPPRMEGCSALLVTPAPTCLLSRKSASGDHWKPAYRLLVHGAGAAPLTLQVYVALLKDGHLDLEELARMTALGGR